MLAVNAIDVGSLPAWIALIGVGVTAATFVGGRHDNVRRAATAVYAIPDLLHLTSSTDADGWCEVSLHNSGDLPIFDVNLAIWTDGSRRRGWRRRQHHEWLEGRRLQGRTFTCIGPSETAKVKFEQLPPLGAQWLSSAHWSSPFTIVFRDGHGRRWVRWPDGRVSRLRRARRLTD